MELDFQNYREKILKPISSDEPCGTDPKYETLYEGIRAEVAKASGIGHGAPDWEKVEADSIQLLDETAKEMNLMAYLVSAMSINHDLEGMIRGFEDFSAFLKAFWPGMFPPLKKVKIRARAISWMGDRVMEQSDIFKIQDRPKLEQALKAVKDLKTNVYEYFSEPPTKFSGIRNAIEDQLATLPEEKPEPVVTEVLPEATKTESSSPAPVSVSAPAAAPPPSNAPEFSAPGVEDLSALADSLSHLAGDLFASDPQLSLCYTLNRETAWISLRTPKSQGGGSTMIPAPVSEIRDSLKIMNSKSNWKDLLARCESLLIRYPFWLDLQYYASKAAKGLGDEYADAGMTIEFFANKVVQKLPDLLKLKFDDGFPFASSSTKRWLSELAAGSGGGGAPAPEMEFASAIAEKGTDNLDECLQIAESGIASAPSMRIKFLFRTEMARFYLDAGQKLWALAILKAQRTEMERRNLEQWEPEICGPVWSLFLEVLSGLPDETPDLRSMTEEARMHLATTRIDLTAEHQMSGFS